MRVIPWLLACLLSVGPAFGQGTPIMPPAPSGVSGNFVWFGPNGQLTDTGFPGFNFAVAHPATGTFYSSQYLTTDTVTGTALGVQEGIRINVTTNGPGTIGSGGHVVPLQMECYAGIVSQDLCVGSESIIANTAGGALVQGYNFLAKLVLNNGTMTNYYMLQPLVTNAGGTITNYVEVRCEAPLTAGTITNRFCLQNADPLQIISTVGRILNSLNQEPASAAAAVPIVGRYMWGINHGAPAGTVTNLNTTTLWAPFLMSEQQAFGHLGINVTTLFAGATCSIAVYKAGGANNGMIPAGNPIISAASVSAAATGNVETSSAYTLDAGRYMFGVNCSSNTVALQAYTENASYSLWGPSTSQGTDTTPTTTGTAFGASPALTFVSNSGVMPQIWIRR